MPESATKPSSVKQRLADINSISIAIDTYDDIFSDFDPRDVVDRDLSEDFIKELARRHRQGVKGKYDVVIVAPKAIENQAIEKKITARLNKYFHQKYLRYKKSIDELRKRGAIYIAVGMLLLAALTLVAYFGRMERLTIELMGIIFMPLGWFGIWEGFSKIVDIPFRLGSDTMVYKGLSKAVYKFEYIVEQKS
jgi:hypothetical protein